MFLRHEKKIFFLSRPAPKRMRGKNFLSLISGIFLNARPAYKANTKSANNWPESLKDLCYVKAKKAGQALVPGHIQKI